MRVTRSDWLDWYVADRESAVLVGDQVLVLSELATVLVDLVGEGASNEELAAGLASQFGLPEERDLLAETSARLRELIDAGVLLEVAGGRS